MRSMPPNAAPRMSGMTPNMHSQQPNHSQAPPAHVQQLRQATGPPSAPQLQASAHATSSVNKHQQPKRVAVKLSTSRLRVSQDTPDRQQQQHQIPWAGQQNHAPPPSQRGQQQPAQSAPPVPSQSQSNFVAESSLMPSGDSTTTGTVMVGGGGQRHGQCASSGSATISGLTNTSNTTATSSNTGGPLAPPGPNLMGAPAPAPAPAPTRTELMDDLSECSCSSNSLDCSLDDPSHSVGSQLDQPLVGGPVGMPLSGHQHHQHQQHPQIANHHQPHNHNHHHQRGHMPPPNNVYRGSSHYNKQQQQHFHHPDHHRHHHHQQQQQQPIYSHHGRAPDHHQNHQHRPLLPHASVPPSLSAAAHPAPLFRHSTYAATSDTLTDESPLHRSGGPEHYSRPAPNSVAYGEGQPPGTNAHQMAHEMIRAPAQAAAHQAQEDVYFSAGQTTNETDLLIGKSSRYHHHYHHHHHHQPANGAGRSANKHPEPANFRRSATTREPDSHRWRGPEGSRQQTYSASDATNTLPLERRQEVQADGSQVAPGAGGSLQRAPSIQGQSQRSSSRNTGVVQKTFASHSGQEAPDDNGTGGINQYHAYSSQQHQHQHQHQPNSRTQSSLEVNAANWTGAHMISSGGNNPSNTSTNLMSVSTPAMPPTGSSTFEGPATFCPPVLPSLPPPPPLPAIPSHRTNSPWMRLSGIILTPVGIVIVLFIVISPLLHYLM